MSGKYTCTLLFFYNFASTDVEGLEREELNDEATSLRSNSGSRISL